MLNRLITVSLVTVPIGCVAMMMLLWKPAVRELTLKEPVDKAYLAIHALAYAEPDTLFGSLFDPSPSTGPPPKADYFRPQRTFLRYTGESENGFGNVQNYTTFDLLLAKDYNPGHFLSMLDLRVQGINFNCKANTYGANIGIVERYIPSNSCRMWGINAYWDYRQGSLAHWNQLGLGVESLGKRWDFRANGYWPLEHQKTKVCTNFDEDGLFMETLRFEYPYAGLNAEIGWKVVRSSNFQLYTAAGPYYLSGNCRKSWGGRARMKHQYKDFASIEGLVSYDDIFGVIYQVQLTISVPFYRNPANHKKAPCGIYNREIYQPVERFDIIPLERGSCTDSNFEDEPSGDEE